MDEEEDDCIYPDCLIRTQFGSACEHSCPHGEWRRRVEWPTEAEINRQQRTLERLFGFGPDTE